MISCIVYGKNRECKCYSQTSFQVRVCVFVCSVWLRHRWHTQGPWAESGPPPCFIRPGTLFPRSDSVELPAPS